MIPQSQVGTAQRACIAPSQGFSRAICPFSHRNAHLLMAVIGIRRQCVPACELSVTVCFHSAVVLSVCPHLHPNQSISPSPACRPGWAENIGKGSVNCKPFSVANCKMPSVSLLVCVNFVVYRALLETFNLSPPTRSHPAVKRTFVNFDDVCGTNPDCFSNYAQLF